MLLTTTQRNDFEQRAEAADFPRVSFGTTGQVFEDADGWSRLLHPTRNFVPDEIHQIERGLTDAEQRIASRPAEPVIDEEAAAIYDRIADERQAAIDQEVRELIRRDAGPMTYAQAAELIALQKRTVELLEKQARG